MPKMHGKPKKSPKFRPPAGPVELTSRETRRSKQLPPDPAKKAALEEKEREDLKLKEERAKHAAELKTMSPNKRLQQPGRKPQALLDIQKDELGLAKTAKPKASKCIND